MSESAVKELPPFALERKTKPRSSVNNSQVIVVVIIIIVCIIAPHHSIPHACCGARRRGMQHAAPRRGGSMCCPAMKIPVRDNGGWKIYIRFECRYAIH